MKMKKHTSLLILSMLVLFSVYICYAYKPIIEYFSPKKDTVSVTIADANFPAVTSIDKANQDSTYTDVINTINGNLTVKSILLPVKNIMQLPELPTGCEITSLTIVLNYLGYPVDKEFMARDYLDKAKPFEGDFDHFFIGSPWDVHSYGCFSPVIAKSAKTFLQDQKSTYQAIDITGSTMQELCIQLQSGTPVIVWASKFIDKKTTITPIRLDDGTTDYWYSNEHCMVLIGYDLQKGTVTLCDPLEGIVEHDFNTFAARYEEFQRMGVIIK